MYVAFINMAALLRLRELRSEHVGLRRHSLENEESGGGTEE